MDSQWAGYGLTKSVVIFVSEYWAAYISSEINPSFRKVVFNQPATMLVVQSSIPPLRLEKGV